METEGERILMVNQLRQMESLCVVEAREVKRNFEMSLVIEGQR